MKRYDVVLGRSGGRPHARCDETPEGAYVRHYVAQRLIDAKQAEIDALKAENERLKASHARYETLRKLNVVQFQHLYTKALQSPIPFDELVDMLGESK